MALSLSSVFSIFFLSLAVLPYLGSRRRRYGHPDDGKDGGNDFQCSVQVRLHL
ncbi:MAG: hypothetical protein MJ058_04245 [Akkermansia sp.]|nr:hypothetical protein [Akkermansia sp.]